MMTGAFSWNIGKLFSKLKLVTDNLLSIYDTFIFGISLTNPKLHVSKCEHNHFNFSNFHFSCTCCVWPQVATPLCHWLCAGWTWLIPPAHKLVSIIEYISTKRRMRQKCHCKISVTDNWFIQWSAVFLSIIKRSKNRVWERSTKRLWARKSRITSYLHCTVHA